MKRKETNMNKPPKAPQHTATPWKVLRDNYGVVRLWSGIQDLGSVTSDGGISREEEEANADYIVCAVNTHNELIELLNDWVRMIPVMSDHTPAEDSLRARSLRALARAEGK